MSSRLLWPRDAFDRMATTPVDASPPRTTLQHRVLKIAAVCAVLVLILLLRRPEMMLHPELWAEDGRIFFVQADTEGARALVTPYSGYHHFLLRVIAAAAAGLNARWVPVAYIAANLATVVLIAIGLFSHRLDLPHPAACALAIGLLPHTGEVIGNLTNLQWLSALGLVWLLIAQEPSNTRQRITDMFLAVITGLTGTFSILLTPLFVWRAWQRKTRDSILLANVVAITGALQLLTFLDSAHESISGTPPTLESIVCLTGFRLAASLLLPMKYAPRLPRAVLDCVGVVSVGLLIATAVWKGKRRNTRGLLAALIVLLIAAAIFRSHAHFRALANISFGDRYFFLPKLLVIWLLLSVFCARGFVGWAAAVGCALALIAALVDWHYEPLTDHHWPEYARRIEAGEAVRGIPLNPKGVTFDHPGRNRRAVLQVP